MKKCLILLAMLLVHNNIMPAKDWVRKQLGDTKEQKRSKEEQKMN
jgi:hypothetical protein